MGHFEETFVYRTCTWHNELYDSHYEMVYALGFHPVGEQLGPDPQLTCLK